MLPATATATAATATHTPGAAAALAALPALPAARVAGAYAKAAVDTARQAGADLQRLGLACGLGDLGQALPENIPVPRYLALLDAAARQLADPFFGVHVGQRMRAPTFVSYGLMLCTCADFRAVIQQTRRFEGLAHDLGRSEVLLCGNVAHYRWHSPWLAMPGGRHLSESVMTGIHAFANWLAGETVPVLDVAFTHARPAGTTLDAYHRMLGMPVRFSAPVTEARFAATLLDAPVSNADTSLFPALERSAEQRLLLRQREALEPAIVPAVRECIQTLLMQDTAHLPDVAQALGLSTRTLQRRLSQARVSFSELLDASRRELAQQYLREGSLSLTDIAFMLGFGQQSNFNHAFRAWFGTTPAAWREAQRQRR